MHTLSEIKVNGFQMTCSKRRQRAASVNAALQGIHPIRRENMHFSLNVLC